MKKIAYTITLPTGQKVTIGSGISNVPSTPDSVKETKIETVIKAAKEASKAGIFDSVEDTYGTSIRTAAR